MKTLAMMGIPLLAVLAYGCAEGDGGGDADAGDSGVDAGGDAGVDTETGTDTGTGLDCDEGNRWWIWDLSQMPPQDAQICATERATGDNMHVVVADQAWGHTVDQAMVDALVAAWDDATPSDSGSGIFDQVTGLFGDPPDVFDGDPRIYLLLYEMEGYMGYSFDGYFRVDDQLDGPTSNRHEMLHINTFTYAPDSDYMLSVQAHEFQHLIHWGEDSNEEVWLNECMSEVAMVLTGFGADEDWVENWLLDPSAPLIPQGNDPGHYGLYMLFGDYLWERFGDAFVGALVSEAVNGVESLDARLAEVDSSLDFRTVFADMALAVIANDPGFAGGIYGYANLDLDPVAAESLEVSSPLEVTVNGHASAAFVESDVDVDGLTLRLTSASWQAIDFRCAVADSAGTHLVDCGLSAETTDVPLGSWPDGGTTLLVTITNATAAPVQLTLEYL